MTHNYTISGMSCDGCRSKVEKTLNAIEGIQAEVTLDPPEAVITMDKHIPTEKFQEVLTAAGKYTIEMNKAVHSQETTEEPVAKSCCSTHTPAEKVALPSNAQGKYYCPMHCEGDKMYDKPGTCPVCGMDLEKIPKLIPARTMYTCPMHPEVIKDGPGSCPICGMDLVPMEPTETEENKTYNDLMQKMKIAVLCTVPIFIISMSEMIPNNPLFKFMSIEKWNWVQFLFSLPVVFYAGWMFFVRACKSIVTWNLNMFTLIGIGTSVAFLFSVAGMFFPDIFPDEFKSHHGTIHLYFEAATVIINLSFIRTIIRSQSTRTNQWSD